MNYYVGTSGYAYPKWKDSFYPKDLSNKKMLEFYARRFRSVEMNGTFYKMPTAAALKEWLPQVPSEFRFVLKAPQRITHFQRLKETKQTLEQFLEAASVLGKQLAPLFFQLPPNFKKDLPRLDAFLKSVPKKTPIAFEFRHASWFDRETFDLLEKHKVALCIADAEDDLKVPFVATTDWGYLRLRRDEYRKADLKKWVKQIEKQKWKEVFVFFKHEDEGRGPKFAAEFLELAS